MCHVLILLSDSDNSSDDRSEVKIIRKRDDSFKINVTKKILRYKTVLRHVSLFTHVHNTVVPSIRHSERSIKYGRIVFEIKTHYTQCVRQCSRKYANIIKSLRL